MPENQLLAKWQPCELRQSHLRPLYYETIIFFIDHYSTGYQVSIAYCIIFHLRESAGNDNVSKTFLHIVFASKYITKIAIGECALFRDTAFQMTHIYKILKI